ncbi:MULTISPECIES: hypothetical protein [Pseudoalteromonas]|uniref:hypothetical protein n=1 Tax=Pseudoalteromonas TaxID=53246 RepID=UPI0003666563
MKYPFISYKLTPPPILNPKSHTGGLGCLEQSKVLFISSSIFFAPSAALLVHIDPKKKGFINKAVPEVLLNLSIEEAYWLESIQRFRQQTTVKATSCNHRRAIVQRRRLSEDWKLLQVNSQKKYNDTIKLLIKIKPLDYIFCLKLLLSYSTLRFATNSV